MGRKTGEQPSSGSPQSHTKLSSLHVLKSLTGGRYAAVVAVCVCLCECMILSHDSLPTLFLFSLPSRVDRQVDTQGGVVMWLSHWGRW